MHRPLLAGLAAASIGVASALVALTTPAAAAAPARSVLYVSSSYDTNLSVYDATTDEFLTRVDLGYQQYATDVKSSPDGSRAYVTTNDSVAIVDTATSTVVHHVLVNTPTATALTPDGSRVFAVSQTGAVSVFPTANRPRSRSSRT